MCRSLSSGPGKESEEEVFYRCHARQESQNVQRYQKMKAERWLEMGLEYKARYKISEKQFFMT